MRLPAPSKTGYDTAIMTSIIAATLRRRLTRLACALALLITAFLSPLIALADDEKFPDARLEGYPGPVALNDGGIGMTVTFLIVLTLITIGVMFINAKRSHLD